MDTVTVDVERKKAGAAYLAALKSLGLDPEGLFWARDKRSKEMVLVLVSSYFDVAGPLGLSSTLFKAYNAAATPKEIDPFIVQLNSPNHRMVRELMGFISNTKIKVRDWDDDIGEYGPVYLAQEKAAITWGNDDIEVPVNDIYKLAEKRGSVDLMRKWKFIERKVDKIAA